ncbi:MAG: D-2-hydroxyacid dehydrogenase [Candidatus Poribacteria bacterium]|nr:D-2-hydroxyacid dehydrogenase [Candidatus Poribacteria bacterium]
MKILTSRLSEEQLDVVREIAPNANLVSVTTPEDVLREIEDTDVLFGTRTTPEMIGRAKSLRWIQVGGVGVEGMMFPELVNSDIILTNGRGTTAINIAEHVIGLILTFTRTININIKRQMEKVWESRANLPVIEIAGETIGILGLGSIGLQVAKRANAFDMRILSVDPTQTEKPDYVESLWKVDRLHDMLRQSDFVAICCPLTLQTEGIMGADEFRVMKSTAFVINIARGRIVDQAALVEALRAKEIAGAGLDATHPEPLPQDNPLWEMDNVIITPHHAGQSPKAPRRVFELFCENLKRFVAGEPLINLVDKTRGY